MTSSYKPKMARSCPMAVHDGVFFYPLFLLYSFSYACINSSHSRATPPMLQALLAFGRYMHPRIPFPNCDSSKFGGERPRARGGRSECSRQVDKASHAARLWEIYMYYVTKFSTWLLHHSAGFVVIRNKATNDGVNASLPRRSLYLTLKDLRVFLLPFSVTMLSPLTGC